MYKFFIIEKTPKLSFGIATHLKYPAVRWIYFEDNQQVILDNGVMNEKFQNSLKDFLKNSSNDTITVEDAAHVLTMNDLNKKSYGVNK